jgi:hypothetical protein
MMPAWRELHRLPREVGDKFRAHLRYSPSSMSSFAAAHSSMYAGTGTMSYAWSACRSAEGGWIKCAFAVATIRAAPKSADRILKARNASRFSLSHT